MPKYTLTLDTHDMKLDDKTIERVFVQVAKERCLSEGQTFGHIILPSGVKAGEWFFTMVFDDTRA